MKKLPFIPEQAYIRHPSGHLEGPFSREQIVEMISKGSVSKYIWVYEIEKRLGTALRDLPEYDHHPNSKILDLYFPNGLQIDLCYYFGLLSLCSGLCLFFPAIIFSTLGIMAGIHGIMEWKKQTQNHTPYRLKQAKFRLYAGLALNVLAGMLGILILVDIYLI